MTPNAGTQNAGTQNVVRVYVAGPMTGLPRFNYDAFNDAERALRALGYEVENPTRGEEPPSLDAYTASDPKIYLSFLRAGLRQLLECTGVACLPDWDRSRGASLEVATARALEMPVAPLAEWVRSGESVRSRVSDSSAQVSERLAVSEAPEAPAVPAAYHL